MSGEPSDERVFIALGSNLGDRKHALLQALETIEADPDSNVLKVSAMHETEPIGGPAGQGRFLNAVAELSTCRSPEALLEFLLSVERALGRARRNETRWGPRIIDLDLLLYGERIVDEPGLCLPHPRMSQRRFVLEPLHEIAADVVHPVSGKTVAVLLEELP